MKGGIKMPLYRIKNRITGEVMEVEAPFAQTACEMAGWMIGDCYVQTLKEGPFTKSGKLKRRQKWDG